MVTELQIPLLFNSSKKVRDKAFLHLMNDPVFSFWQRKIVPKKDNIIENQHIIANGQLILDLFKKERLDKLSTLIANIPDDTFEYGLKSLAEFPGITNLDISKIFSEYKSVFLNDFNQYRFDFINNSFPKQITVVPSYNCNFSCNYCFAKDLYKMFPNMNIDLFKDILKYAKMNSIKRISLLGGEPTIFPMLEYFIREIERYDLNFYFATNGLAKPDTWNSILNSKKLEGITVHINRDEDYKKSDLNLLVKNLETAINMNCGVIFRYNLRNADLLNWDFLDKYITIVPEFRFSFAIVFPSGSLNNDYVSISDYSKFSSKIESLIEAIKYKSQNKKFEIVLAKPLPLCVFEDQIMEKMINNLVIKNICEIDKNNFTNNVTINPDGSFYPCMALNSPKYLFNPYNTIHELSGHFYNSINSLPENPILKECSLCTLFINGLCQCVCYSYCNNIIPKHISKSFPS